MLFVSVDALLLYCIVKMNDGYLMIFHQLFVCGNRMKQIERNVDDVVVGVEKSKEKSKSRTRIMVRVGVDCVTL